MEYKDMQYPTRQDMRNEIARLNTIINSDMAWLIEISTPDGARWYTHDGDFVSNVHKAIRFCRREDADAVDTMLGLHEFGTTITEHLFCV